MKRNLKVLGLAMMAVCALGAVAASSAQAVPNTHHVTTPGIEKSVITATDHVNTKFIITGGEHSVTCDETLYEGTLPKETNEKVTVTPTYKKCKVDGFISTVGETIDINHCAYVLEGTTDANGDAPVEVECSGTDEITITYSIFGSSCVVHVTPQTKYGVHYTHTKNPSTEKTDITVSATVKGITYHETGGGFCPANHTGTDGTLEGAVTAQAYEHKGSELSGTELTTPTLKEGNVIDLDLNENVTEKP